MGGFRIFVATSALLAVASLAVAGDREEAESLAARGEFYAAVDHFARALAADPGNEEIRLGFARSLSELRKFDDAARVLDEGLRRAPGSVPLLLLRGSLSLDQGEMASRSLDRTPEKRQAFKRARECFEAVLAKDPKDVGGRLLKARWIQWQEDLDPSQARRLFEEVVADAPDDFDVRDKVGHFWEWMGSRDTKNKELWKNAEESFRAALKLKPDNGHVAYHMALAKQWRGAPARDLRLDYEKALELAPDNRGCLTNLLKLYPDDNQRRALIDRLLERSPSDSTLLTMKVQEMMRAGDQQGAMNWMAAVEKKFPEDPLVPMATGVVHASMRDMDGMVEALLRSIGLCKGVVRREVYDTVDIVCLTIPNPPLTPDHRDRLWTALWKAFPGEINGPNNAEVWLRDQAGDIPRSMEWCRRALAIHPDDVAILNDMGLNHNTPGWPGYDLAKAEEYWKKAIVAAREQGINSLDQSTGYTNAVDNLVKMMVTQLRWSDLEKLADDYLKEDPRYESVLQLSKSGTGAPPPGTGPSDGGSPGQGPR